MKKAEAKKISLGKYKKEYEEAIQKIESQLIDLTQEQEEIKFKCDKLPVFVVEAIIKHFKDDGWKIFLDSFSGNILIGF